MAAVCRILTGWEEGIFTDIRMFKSKSGNCRPLTANFPLRSCAVSTQLQGSFHQAKLSVRVQKDNLKDGSGKSEYERSLMLKGEKFGIKYYSDANQNRICILSGELEAWILDICAKTKIDPTDFGLPAKHKELKKVILFRLDNLARLFDELIRQKNPAICQLKFWLK